MPPRSAVLTDLKEAQPRALTAAPVQDQEWELRDIDLEMVDDGGTDHSSDGDYADESDAAGSQIEGRPHSQKRVRRTVEYRLPNRLPYYPSVSFLPIWLSLLLSSLPTRH